MRPAADTVEEQQGATSHQDFDLTYSTDPVVIQIKSVEEKFSEEIKDTDII